MCIQGTHLHSPITDILRKLQDDPAPSGARAVEIFVRVFVQDIATIFALFVMVHDDGTFVFGGVVDPLELSLRHNYNCPIPLLNPI